MGSGGNGECISAAHDTADQHASKLSMHTDGCNAADDLLIDPLLQYLPPSSQRARSCPSPHFDVDAAIEALTTQGYCHVPAVLTEDECDEALAHLWDFVEDVAGGCVDRTDPTSWYPRHEVNIRGREAVKTKLNGEGIENSIISDDSNKHDDVDPWPHTGYPSFPDMFQSLGAGYVLGDVREALAERIFAPLFGTRELLSSKEGFTFSRPLVVDMGDDGCKLAWQTQRQLYRVCGKPQPRSEGQHCDQGVPAGAVKHIQNDAQPATETHAITDGISKKQQNRMLRKTNKQQRYKDLAGLCHIQASVSFTDQALDRHRGGGHFLCHSNSHSDVHWKLVGGTYRATPFNASNQGKDRMDPTWVPLTDEEIERLDDMGCPERRIYAGRGDVILWRSDLVHAGVAPTLVTKEGGGAENGYDGPREFRAVGYCGMLPVQAVEDYALYYLPKHKVVPHDSKNGQRSNVDSEQNNNIEKARRMVQARTEALARQKLEAYKTGRTGDHRPNVEAWHEHRRRVMWNRTEASQQGPLQLPVPPRILQRPRFRLGPPELTARQAELYGLLPYRPADDAICDEKVRQKDIERAVIRGVRFVEGVYKGKNGDDEDTWTIKDGKFCSKRESADVLEDSRRIPICLANMEVLTTSSDEGTIGGLSGQDKYLGGMASPCGRFIYGVPGHAKRVVRVDVRTGDVDFIGPEYSGEFKWLRGVEIPAEVMGTNVDSSLSYPSGCCLALPCNSVDGCVLKIDPETSRVSTFVTGPPIPNVEEGWLYHGGNLSWDGYIYAIPASAPRVMKIDPRLETTEYIGPEFPGKAKWYGGIVGIDGCIYGVPHNATGVLKIDPKTDEVTVMAEGTLDSGRWKWHGGLASLDSSKIIGFPNNADSVLIIDILEHRVYTVGDGSILRSGSHRVPQDGRYKYLGGALTEDGKFAYLFPCDAEYVLRFDMDTHKMKPVGERFTEGENKFQNGFVGTDSCIYGIPQRNCSVLRIIPPGVERYGRDGKALPAKDEHVDVIYCGDELVSCKDKFEGGVQGLDGKIYCIPLRAKAFVNIIPSQK